MSSSLVFTDCRDPRCLAVDVSKEDVVLGAIRWRDELGQYCFHGRREWYSADDMEHIALFMRKMPVPKEDSA